MYIIRVYKDYETNRVVGMRVVNESTLDYGDFSIKDIRQMMIVDPKLIVNAELDKNRVPRLRNYNPEQKIKYYTQTFENNVTINHYCIIIGCSHGTLKFIADTYKDNIICGNGVTLGEIAAKLNEPDVYKLKIYNATIKKVDNQPFITVYDNRGKHPIQLLNQKYITDIFGENWEVSIEKVTQEGIAISSLENIAGEYEATIPDGVYYIGRFRGGVNVLNLPISVHKLGDGCFENIDDLLELNFGDGIRVIPEDCCRNSSIKKVTFSGYLEEICEGAFEDSCYLRGAIVTGAKIIGKRAFSSTSIGIVSLDGTEIIDIEAFAYNSRLYKLKLGEGLKEIRGGAFRYCQKLEEIYFPASLEKIGKLAFEGCKKLKVVHVRRGTLISKSAFPKNTKIIYY